MQCCNLILKVSVLGRGTKQAGAGYVSSPHLQRLRVEWQKCITTFSTWLSFLNVTFVNLKNKKDQLFKEMDSVMCWKIGNLEDISEI